MSSLHDQLQFLEGDFVGTETNHASAWAAASEEKATASGTFEDGVDVLVQRQAQSGGFTAVNVFTMDRNTEDIVLYSFDSVGYLPDPPARGSWVDGELILLRSTDRGHARTKYAVVEGGYAWSKEFMPTDGSEWSVVVNGTLSSV